MAKKFLNSKVVAQMPHDYVEPQTMTFDEFPVSDLHPEGMKILDIEETNKVPSVNLNVVYAQKDGMDLHLNIIVPALEKDRAIYPLIMWVQGSAFHKQNVNEHLADMIEVAKNGFVVAMVEYRYAPKWAFPVQVRDLNTATRYMLNHANTYHIDPKKYIAWGDSSGGHTVSLASVTENNQFFSDEDILVEPLSFKACVDFYGPTDISRMNKVISTQDHVTAHSLEGEFLGTKNVYKNLKLVQKANPTTYIKNNIHIPPFLIMHGDKDRFVPFEQSCLLYEVLKKNSKKVRFYKIENCDHASGKFYTSEIRKIVIDFIRRSFE